MLAISPPLSLSFRRCFGLCKFGYFALVHTVTLKKLGDERDVEK